MGNVTRHLARYRSRRRLALLALLLLVALVAWKGIQVVRAAWVAQRDAAVVLSLARDLRQNPAGAEQIAALGPALRASAASMGWLRDEVRPLEPLLAATRPLPPGVNWLADLPDVLSVAAPLLQVGAIAVAPFSEPVQAVDPQQGRMSRYLAALAALAPRIPELARGLEAAEAPLSRLQGRPLGGPLRSFAPLLDQMAPLLPEARSSLDLLEAIGPALGMEGPRTYLLLGQNSGEMRATGGFIGSAGTLTIEKGAVSGLEYVSSYAADPRVKVPPPPAPLSRYLGLGGWYLRDANWWPDFPASAAQVEMAWMRAGHPPVDGVIAFDTSAVKALLRGVGSLDLPGHGSVTADSFERLAAEQLYSQAALSSTTAFHQAKGVFLGAVGRALVQRLGDLSPADLLPVGREVLKLLREKHLQLAFKDQRLIRAIHARGWDGAIPPVPGDSLYVVDTTVSYGDTYQFVSSNTEIRVKIGEEGDGQEHSLVLQYINKFPIGLPSWMPATMVGGATFDSHSATLTETPGYWGNWLRVYLPSDAREIAVEGLSDVAPVEPQFGRVVVAGYLPLPPGERRVVQIRYVTGGAKEAGNEGYRLFLQKQAGLDCRPVSLEVAWPGGETGGYRGCPTGDQWIHLRGAGGPSGSGGSD